MPEICRSPFISVSCFVNSASLFPCDSSSEWVPVGEAETAMERRTRAVLIVAVMWIRAFLSFAPGRDFRSHRLIIIMQVQTEICDDLCQVRRRSGPCVQPTCYCCTYFQPTLFMRIHAFVLNLRSTLSTTLFHQTSAPWLQIALRHTTVPVWIPQLRGLSPRLTSERGTPNPVTHRNMEGLPLCERANCPTRTDSAVIGVASYPTPLVAAVVPVLAPCRGGCMEKEAPTDPIAIALLS